MPRKMRQPKARREAIDVSPALYRFVLFNEYDAAADDELLDDLYFFSDEDLRARIWRQIEDEALLDWIRVFPGRRPTAWWHFSAPTLRTVFGRFTPATGLHRCNDVGVPYGAPVDSDDRPMLESEAGLLDRLGLFLSGERARVPAKAFEPQPFAASRCGFLGHPELA